MKRKVVAGLVLAGILGISGTALAADTPHKHRKQSPQEIEQSAKPKLPPKESRDKRPELREKKQEIRDSRKLDEQKLAEQEKNRKLDEQRKLEQEKKRLDEKKPLKPRKK